MLDEKQQFANYIDLKKYLADSGINMSYIAINRSVSDLDFCIQEDNDSIAVFWFERGIYFDKMTFADRNLAISYYLKLINKNISLFK